MGIVGIGFGQHVHIPAVRSISTCQVTALAASTQERADQVAQRHDVPIAYGTWQALVASPEVDLVSIATPPAVQMEIIRASLTAGKPVFCEKPVALTAENARELANQAQCNNIPSVVNFEFREIPAWQLAKSILDSGEIGTLRHIAINWNVETYANKMGLDSWKTRPKDGGGTLNMFVSHSFYYIEWLAGPIRRLTARLGKALHDTRTGDTVAALCLELESGCLVSLSVSSHAFLGSGHKLEFYGTQGTLLLENATTDYVRGFQLHYGTRSSNELKRVEVEPDDNTAQDGRIVAVSKLIDGLVRWILNGTPASPTLFDGARVQTLLDAAKGANAQGCWIDTPEPH